jgi:trehalose 6-phosphate synthase/phosphatase
MPKNERKEAGAEFMTRVERGELVRSFQRARRRLLLLDYDGTLAPYVAEPETARPGPAVLRVLKALAGVRANEVVLVSGRDKNTLTGWFGALPISLVAEHGAWIREDQGYWRMTRLFNNDWKARVVPVLRRHADRLPGAFVEEKEFSCAWHYRKSDPALGLPRVKELMDDLCRFAVHRELQVLQGNCVVEIRNAQVNKGKAAMNFISQETFDFILAAGDDAADEDLFEAVPQNGYSLRVGAARSHARFNLPGPADVLALLRDMQAGS